MSPLFSHQVLIMINKRLNVNFILRALLVTASVFGITVTTFADTTQDGRIFTIDEGVSFEIGNVGASDYLFDWSDPDGVIYSEEEDPTLTLQAGELYTFVRTSSAHPFIILNESAASFISGTDGQYFRTTTDSVQIENTILTPVEEFVADPFPSEDVIEWRPTVGDYWYTCRVTSHTLMAGRISVVPEPATAGLALLAAVAVFGVSRRSLPKAKCAP